MIKYGWWRPIATRSSDKELYASFSIIVVVVALLIFTTLVATELI